MPPPHDGNELKAFAELMQLERLENTGKNKVFRSTALAFAPGGQRSRAYGVTYGGHVFAQAAWAAAQTVGPGLLLYNVTGNFITPGQPSKPFVYRVRSLPNGKSSATRIVDATQSTEAHECFTCVCAFRKEDPGAPALALDAQDDLDLWKKYEAVLRGRPPHAFKPVPGMDVPWYLELLATGEQDDDFPGLEMTQPDMEVYNTTRHPLDRRQLMFYRATGDMPTDNPNLHLCAHLYASDRNGLYIIAGLLDVGDVYTQMSSLTHTVIFHSPIEELLFRPSVKVESAMDDDGACGRWFCLEDWTDRVGGGRMMLHRRIWGSSGQMLLSIIQDGLVRFSKKPTPTQAEVDAIRERVSRWKTRL